MILNYTLLFTTLGGFLAMIGLFYNFQSEALTSSDLKGLKQKLDSINGKQDSINNQLQKNTVNIQDNNNQLTISMNIMLAIAKTVDELDDKRIELLIEDNGLRAEDFLKEV